MLKSIGLALLSTLLGGCLCTEIGCEDQVAITVSSAAPMPAGRYVFQFATPTAVLPVTCTLAADKADCTSTDKVDAAAPFNDGTWRFRLRGTPASVRVIVDRDGATVADQALAPSYGTNRPNGPQCAPECRQATAAITL